MPEGPECRRVTDKLRSSGQDKLFLFIDFHQNASQKYLDLQMVWNTYLEKFPAICLDIICRGKQIFFFFDNGIAFWGGLGMEGHWYRFTSPGVNDQVQTTPESEYLKRVNAAKNRSYPKFSLNFGNVQNIPNSKIDLFLISTLRFWYDDKLSYGNFNIGDWSNAFSKMRELGPDLIAVTCPIPNIHPKVKSQLPDLFFEQLDANRFKQILLSKSKQNICKVLMDPKLLSGIGNYLKSEILYRAKISPFREIQSLSESEILTLYQVTIDTIISAYNSGGLTHGTFLDPDFETGTFEKIVYKQKDQLDPNGYKICYTKKIDGRGTFYVPEIQV